MTTSLLTIDDLEQDVFDLDLTAMYDAEGIRMGECSGFVTQSCGSSSGEACTCTEGTCAFTCGGVTGSPCAC